MVACIASTLGGHVQVAVAVNVHDHVHDYDDVNEECSQLRIAPTKCDESKT
jgi:hypothetical protein